MAMSTMDIYVTEWNWTTVTSAPNNVVLRSYLDKGLLNEADSI